MQSRYSKQVPSENQLKYGAVKTKVYGRQPATAFVFDMGSGISGEAISNVCDTLENLFSMACTLGGPCRIPFVSVMVLTTFHEVLLPMVGVRGNFTRILSCLKEIREMAENMTEVFSSAKEEGVSQALIEVCMQYQHHWQGNFQSSAPQCLLQIFLITNKNNKNLPDITKMVEKAIQTVNVEHLKRIQVVGICSFNEIISGGGEDGEYSISQIASDSENSGIETGDIVEMVTIESDPISLQIFFGGLFKDSGSDNEHLHLILPPSSDLSPLVVKCDLFERLISPTQLPFQQQFFVHTEGTSGKPLLQPSNKISGVALPLLKIQIRQVLPSSCLCESLLFGMPYIVEPTSSWKIDWDELERNRKNFRALCHLLFEKNNVLIGRLERQDTDSSTIQSAKKSNVRPFRLEEPQGYFVLLPTQNGSMLIKSLACKELMLHYHQESPAEHPSISDLQLVEASLNKVPQSDIFNPLLEASGLYSALKKLVTHNSQSGLQKRTVKPLYVESPKVKQKQPLFGSSKGSIRKVSPGSSNQNRKAHYSLANSSDWVDDADFFSEMD